MKLWLKADYQVYDYFQEKLERNLQQFGDKPLIKELKQYHKAQHKVKEKCPIQLVAKKSLPKEDRPFGTGTEAYKILSKDKECQFIGMQELKFTSFLRNLQSQRIRNKTT